MTLFINDYSEGCHERILEALTRTNRVQTTGYGTDPYCAEARDILRREMACPDADIWFLSGGTQTNLIALTAALRPHEAVGTRCWSSRMRRARCARRGCARCWRSTAWPRIW